MEEARLDWLRRAKEIKDGKRQSFIEHLESRGLIHDVVGCVALDSLQLALH
jgi:tyrosyl-tRNA synthetase